MRLINFLNEKTEDPAKIVKIIKEKCSYFLNLMGDNEYTPLFRGMEKAGWNDELQKFKVQKRRKPLNTDESVSKLLDSGFNSIFGIKARTQTAFCTGDRDTAINYGHPYYMFPIDKFDYIWSPKINDLYINFEFQYFKDDESAAFSLYCDVVKWYNRNDVRYPVKYAFMSNESLLNKILKNTFNIELKDKEFNTEYDRNLYIGNEIMKTKKDVINKLRDIFIKKNYIKNKDFIDAIKSKNEIMLSCNNYYVVSSNIFTEKYIWEKLFN